MTLASPSALQAFLAQLGVRPSRYLSQNFLIDRNILHKILLLADVKRGEAVVEIGAGPGALTESLLEVGAEVTAIEKDPLLAQALFRFTERAPCFVYAGDVRSFPWESLASRSSKSKVVANLPYHLTRPILELLVPRTSLFSTLTLMVQEEVARKIIAEPSSPEYGEMSLFVHFYAEPCYGFPVRRRCFHPAPHVDSAVVHLTLRKPPLQETRSFFLQVRHAFAQRRKMLKSSWRTFYPAERIERALKELGYRPEVRPEELSCTAFVELYQMLIPAVRQDG